MRIDVETETNKTRPWGRPLALALLVVASAAIAGCASESPTSDTDGDPEPPPVNAREPPASRSLAFRFEDCLNARFFWVVSHDHARDQLPPGVEPLEAAEALRNLGIPVPPGILQSGQAVVGYDAVECNRSNLLSQPLQYSALFVIIETPTIEGAVPERPATADLYLPGYLSNDATWVDFLSQAGAETVWLGDVVPALGLGPGDGTGSGTVVLEGQQAAFLEYRTTGIEGAGPAFQDQLFRGWIIGPNGTTYFDTPETAENIAGTSTGCRHPADGPYAKVTGTRDCAGAAASVLTSVRQDLEGTAYWLPGAGVVS
jgi:hypothetical protein